MDSSRRAVESYWRSRMVDGATSDEDKVTPVYKLEEICHLLRSSHVSIVKEVSDFVLKRLDHKSPIVKQKALRLIKYCVGKSGAEFRREMQKNSAAVRQLFHYKGKPDALKGDALNKAVRDIAHETISAIFSEENKPEPTRDVNKRIQGFGNTNFEMPSEDRKSFLSEVVGLGSASIKQGLSTFAQGQSARKNENGSYKSPNLRRSLTLENDSSERYEPARLPNGTQYNFGGSKDAAGGSWGPESRSTNRETTNGDSNSSFKEGKTREERLLETIVTSGGVRLQPTRDAIQVFLVEAAKLDALALTRALESKIQSPLWQVRLKAVCVLESILRRKEDALFSVIASYFGDNRDLVVRCSESPQTSLREKANRVLNLLGGELGSSNSSMGKSEKVETAAVHIPDLIDTGDENEFFQYDSSIEAGTEKRVSPATTAAPSVDDLLGDDFATGFVMREEKNDEDPFSDVSFHAGAGREQIDDLFSGMVIDDKSVDIENHVGLNSNQAELFDIFGSSYGALKENANHKPDFNDLMSNLSSNENIPELKQQEVTTKLLPEATFSDSGQPNHQAIQANDDASGSILGSQITGMNAGPMFPPGTMPIPGMAFNPAFSQPFNYNAMGAFLAQQQFLAAMTNLQNLNNMNAPSGAGHNVTINGSGNASALPDIFQTNHLNQGPSSTMNSTKKEDTRAFDFISDHLAAARDPKRVL